MPKLDVAQVIRNLNDPTFFENARHARRKAIKDSLKDVPEPENMRECMEYAAKVLEAHIGFYSYDFEEVAEILRAWSRD